MIRFGFAACGKGRYSVRYLGNKTKLLPFIDDFMSRYGIKGESFVDLFSGTAAVADHMKGRFTVLANDYMKFSFLIAEAKILNPTMPKFCNFCKMRGCSPFEWLNNQVYEANENCFIWREYSPAGERMYFTEENAVRIDGMRVDIERAYKEGLFDEREYAYMLASLLESAQRIANTSGTFQAYFKFWEQRALKKMKIAPLEIESQDLHSNRNIAYCEDANELAREISGDIVYIDPPYTTTQYTNMYHVLETIARYDNPEVFGKTGRRKKRVLSHYSNSRKALVEFEDLLRQLNCNHIMISYSNQSIVSLEELKELCSRFSVDGEVFVEKSNYREYASNNQSYKTTSEGLKEALIYFRKDCETYKSPLNYSGSKNNIISDITKRLPKHIGTFVDVMGGAFNVGSNIVATDRIVYNEKNPYVFELIDMLAHCSPDALILDIEDIIEKYGLEKQNKNAYIKLRNSYNSNPNPVSLYTLHIYSFQNIIRFNAQGKMNTPVGNNDFNDGFKRRIVEFANRACDATFINRDYRTLNIDSFPPDTMFYFDPPYFLSTAEYNDGKRGVAGWNASDELELLDKLLEINRKGYLFMLSNVLKHKGRVHHLLMSWIEEHRFKLHIIGKTGIKYPRIEILVTNY